MRGKQSKKPVAIAEASRVQAAQSVELQEIETTLLSKNQITTSLILSYFKDLTLNEIITENQVIAYTLCGKKNNFKIASVLPKLEENAKWIINGETVFRLQEKSQQVIPTTKQVNTIYGLDRHLNRLLKLVEDSLGIAKDRLLELGFAPVKGILVVGQSGVGKSTLLHALRKSLAYNVVYFSSYDSDDIFNINHTQPTLILLDNLPNQNEQLIKQIGKFFDSLAPNDHVLVIGATASLKNIDESLRRGSRFEKELLIDIPNHNERCQIISSIANDVSIALDKEQTTHLSYQMSGFTINDIRSVFRDILLGDGIKIKNFQEVLRGINPSGIRDLLVDTPSVRWSDIGGYEHVKQEVRKVIEWPLKHADAFTRLGVRPSKGILLYGPPGCCKTLIARAIASECNLNFMAIKGPELFSKYVGDSEKAVREIFKKARLCSPSVIFFDEIDSIAPQRSGSTDVADRVLIQLLTELDGFEELKNVIVVGATNRPDSIDKALLRPGRFDHLIYVDIPDAACREEIFRVCLRKMKVSDEVNEHISEAVERTNGFTGAEISQVCKESGLFALSRSIDCEVIEWQDVLQSIMKLKPRVTPLLLSVFRNFQENAKMNL